MKVAFVGKGGSGKTTLAALFCRSLQADGQPLLAVDADINQHLAVALGATEDETAALPALGDHMDTIKEYLRGDNPRIAPSTMIKTTPPGHGSNLLRVTGDNPIYAACVREVAGIRTAVTGSFTKEDLGVSCYHSKTGAVELVLNHMLDGAGEYVVVDMTAGADAFASGLFSRFDMTFLVCEPTVRSVGVYRQYLGYAKDFGVRLAVVGNKVEDEGDIAFLREQVGNDLLAWVGRSGFVKAAERGKVLPISELEPANTVTIQVMREAVDASTKDWGKYAQQAAEFHRRYALAWGNASAGTDLTEQIDPRFVMTDEVSAA